ncbi:hypothetical protein KAR48_00880 [bacterium]|nr:hypothetical protein [bacterium]
MDEIEKIEWQPAPLPIERVKPSRPISRDKDAPEKYDQGSGHKRDDEEEEQHKSSGEDTYQREDEDNAQPVKSKNNNNAVDDSDEDESEPGHLIDITI